MAAETETDPALQDASWDLESLLDGQGEERIDAQLDEAQQRADAFAERYAGKVAELDGPGLVAAMREIADIYELVGKAGSYASLRFSTDTTDPARGALLQKVEERGTAIETKLLFFGLEWAAQALDLWGYSELMPTVEVLGRTVGLSPIVQVMLLPALSVYLASRLRLGCVLNPRPQ